jgi:hypothetical protein
MMNLVSQWHIRYLCGLGMGWCESWLAYSPLGTQALSLSIGSHLKAVFS